MRRFNFTIKILFLIVFNIDGTLFKFQRFTDINVNYKIGLKWNDFFPSCLNCQIQLLVSSPTLTISMETQCVCVCVFQLQGGTKQQNGYVRWTMVHHQHCPKNPPRKTSALHFAMASFSAMSSTKSILVLFSRLYINSS
jgi:hypothetical protein